MRAGVALSLIAASALVLAGCTGRVAVRGNLPDAERLAEVVPGEISRDEVSEILGSPSSVAAFDGETWFYVSEKTETLAFLKPKIVERKVIVVSFDDEGMVEEVRELGIDDAKQIDPVDRKTPTSGNEFTFMDQLIGNFGRFNSPGG